MIIDAAGNTSPSLGMSGGATGGHVRLTFAFPVERWAAAEFVRLELGKIEFTLHFADLGLPHS
ncbi:hypothetical protein [Microlunatus sp. GCM10028923]|uniref:hypothetical protein n=1 Tax=Microlunatus sp. GCM10028923 TaxID=3273400 RepID=UPI00361A192E